MAIVQNTIAMRMSSSFDELEKICVDLFGMGGWHAVRETRIRL